MKRRQLYGLCLSAALLIFSSITRADNNEVAAWAQQVLLATLSVDFSQTPQDSATVRTHYTKNAWDAAANFLGNYMQKVRAQKLTLHPVLNGPATLVASGAVNEDVLPGIKYWRVNQQVVIPELNITVDFSLLIMMTSTANKFLVQSIDMAIH